MNIIKFNNVVTFSPKRANGEEVDVHIPLDGELNELLSAEQIQNCGALETFRNGFVPINGEEYALSVGDFVYIVYQENKKTVPSSTLADLLAERVDAIKEEQERVVGRAETKELKEQILFQLLPNIIQTSKRTGIIIDTKTNHIYISETSPNKAEDVVAALRKALGSLPVVHRNIGRENVVSNKFASWLHSSDKRVLQGTFALGDSCEMESTHHGSKIRITGTDITNENVTNHLEQYKPFRVNIFNDVLDLDLHISSKDILTLRKLKIRDIDQIRLSLGLDDGEEGDAMAELGGDVLIYGNSLRALWNSIDEEFSDVEEDDGIVWEYN